MEQSAVRNEMPSVREFDFNGNIIRVIIQSDNSAFFVATDLAKILAYRDAAALTRTLDEDEKGTHPVSTPGGIQRLTIVSEAGLYKAILQRQTGRMEHGVTKEIVKGFQHWVTHEVLPQIRRTGGYIPVSEEDDEKSILAKAILISQRTLKEKDAIIAERDRQLAEQRPKVEFADSITASPDSVPIAALAHDLEQYGIRMGRNRLFAWLRDNGYLYKTGMLRNEPKQKYVENGWFRVQTGSYADKEGIAHATRTTRLTGKGRAALTRLLIAANN